MTPLFERIADTLMAALGRLNIHVTVEPQEDGVRVPLDALNQLRSAIAFVEGGSRVPFVRALIARPGADGLFLRRDEGMHLARALDDIAASMERARSIASGRIPARISASEAVKLGRMGLAGDAVRQGRMG